ncbi:MAG: phosphoribosylpyrophosphate synthetase, partial [Chitinophagaceae bacterium]|nr:phosphoribosylpyrophosphate synthetase [Chitinophagaceae bacterium]
EKTMPAYDTVTEALKDLKARGFTTDFNISFDKLQCSRTRRCLSPEEFEIVEHHRFEGDSNPSDEEVVYAIESKDGSMKGVLVSAFGIYSDRVEDAMLKKLQVKK